MQEKTIAATVHGRYLLEAGTALTGRRQVLVEEGAHFVAEGVLFGRVLEIHRRASSGYSDCAASLS